MQRRKLLIGSLALVVATPAVGVADVKPFDAKAFATAQETGQSVVVYVHAPW